jgi:hypothetical protein
VATPYLLGVSTRRAEKLAELLGVTKLRESQVSVMAELRPRDLLTDASTPRQNASTEVISGKCL